MKRLSLALVLGAPLLFLPACGGSKDSGGVAGGGGGTVASGGTTSSATGAGGMPGSGGAAGSGGTTAGSTSTRGSGGTTSATGGSASGGTTSVAGSTTMGGSAAGGSVTGGAPASGGVVGTGGATQGGGGGATGGSRTGGAASTGGVATGGAAGGGSGGQTGAGGTIGTGGTTTTGGTTGSGTGALIKNDVFWKDTSGNNIYSQGGGVLKAGNTYYWYGVNYGGAAAYAASPTQSNSDTSFVAVTIYSSTDLANWKFEGNALTMASVSAKATMDSSTWIGRVGAAYNATSKKYVLIGQYLGTPNTTQFFATSDTPNGAFAWDHTQAVITNVTNSNCGDQSIFNDDDGKAYILCSSESGRSNTYIVPLRDADFLEAMPATRIFGGAGREGNAMFKTNGRYYVCSSDLHGWNASHSYYISATNIMGPYGTEGVIGNTDLDFSHVTQTGLFVTVKGTAQETVIFGGDRWSDFAGNGIGFNEWMPLSFNGTTATMQSFSAWSLDATTGAFAVGPGNNFVMNPSFEADRVATSTPAGWTAGGGTNVTGSHSGHWSWQLSGSLDQQITNVPNGTYTLSVWAKGSTGTLYAKGFGGTDLSTSLTAGTSWTKVSLTGMTVSNGTCDVGISSGSGNVDDFTLVKN